MTLTPVWLFEADPDTMWKLGKQLVSDGMLGMPNAREIAIAHAKLCNATDSLLSDDVPLPDGFPAPLLALPEDDFAPDYFELESHGFCSRRLRDVLAQPPDVVEFTPVQILAGGEQARAREYQVMRVLVRQPAMNLEQSDCKIMEWADRATGQPRRSAMFISRFALLSDLRPCTDLFRIDESPSHVLVTDALAERVMLAGCTGIEFADPACPRIATRVRRYRTAHGVAERRVGFLD